MLGNSVDGVLGTILAAMLQKIYTFLYRPDDITTIFSEFDSHVWDVYTDGWFQAVYAAVQIIGLGLLVLSFLITLMDKVSAGDFTINNFFRHWLRFFILYIILYYSMDIFRWLMGITSDVFTELHTSITAELAMDYGNELDQTCLANGINRYIGLVTEFGIFMMAIIPYAVACLFSVVLYFFAVSRLFEITIRIAVAPVAVGISYFVKGMESDFVRYVKRTMGIFFQIVVVLIISLGLTVTHNAMIEPHASTSPTKIANPAEVLEIDNSIREVEVKGAWREAIKEQLISTFYPDAYTEESITKFIDELFDTDTYFVSTGLMLAGLFMIFKSREISTQAFS